MNSYKKKMHLIDMSSLSFFNLNLKYHNYTEVHTTPVLHDSICSKMLVIYFVLGVCFCLLLFEFFLWKVFLIIHHYHLTQYIPLIEKLWTGYREGRTATTHTYKGERDQRSPPTRESFSNWLRKINKVISLVH